MRFFDRKKDQEKDEVSARLSQYVGQQPSQAASEEGVESESFAAAHPLAAETESTQDFSGDEGIRTAELDPDTGEIIGGGATDNAAVVYAPEPSPAPPPSQAAPPSQPQVFAGQQPPVNTFFPVRPETIEDTGLQRGFVADLLVRTIYQAGEILGTSLAEQTGLSLGVISPLIEGLRHDQEIEVKGQRGIGDGGYLYAITERGIRHARDAMERLNYVGPAPVTLDSYIDAVLAQSVRNVLVTHETIRAAFADLIIDDDILDMVGPAINSGSSMFLFGYPGNGKTSIAERITKLMGDCIFVPYAVEVGGAVITLFDAINHKLYSEPGRVLRPDWDTRWVKIERPVVMVGGELTMDGLDLLYNEVGKFYEAPLQMKANGGMFLIDDFGRQMVRPQDLLNRWIVPLEKRIDFLNLVTGKKIAIPFEQLIVFSTNLDPKDLVDEAFLRRIKFKINVVDPNEDQFRQIFEFMCNKSGISYNDEVFRYMIDTYYRPVGRPMRMCQPRDIIDQIVAISKYKMVPPEISRPLIDRACETYFVNVS